MALPILTASDFLALRLLVSEKIAGGSSPTPGFPSATEGAVQLVSLASRLDSLLEVSETLETEFTFNISTGRPFPNANVSLEASDRVPKRVRAPAVGGYADLVSLRVMC